MKYNVSIKVSLFFCSVITLNNTVWAQGLDTTYQELATNYSQPMKVTDYVVPALLIGYGFTALHSRKLGALDRSTNAELREDHPSFAFGADDHLRYAPAMAVYGLDMAGIKSKHNLVDRTALLLISGTLSSATSGYLKGATRRLRPNGGNYHSFPSGHATMAFMTAEYMNQEYGDRSVWYSIGGYVAATATGTLRLYNGAHWFSDVVAGAGIGIASTKLTYLLYPYFKKVLVGDKAAYTMISPTYQSGYAGFVYVHAF